MTVEYNKEGVETAEQIGEKIVDFVRMAEFGTARYLAVSDYFELQRLQYSLSIEQRNELEAKGDKDRSSWQGAVRITEIRIALREHEISQREYSIKGYGRGHSHLKAWFSDLATVSWKEAEDKFPEDKDQQSRYVNEIYDKADNTAEDTVWRKWDEEPSEK